MAGFFQDVFGKSHAGICVLQEGGTVRFQNQACRRTCGKFVGGGCPQTCVLTCERILGRALPREGMRFFPQVKVGNEYFDILFLSESPYRTVVLKSLKALHDSKLKRLKGLGLSRREMEIAGLRLRGFTNSRIAGSLCISKATLKTHLNNVYKKVPEARVQGWGE